MTDEELAVLRLIAEGHGNPAIAERLSWSEALVKRTVRLLVARFGTVDRAGLVGAGYLTGALVAEPQGPAPVLDPDLHRVLVLLARGLTNQQIGSALGTSSDAAAWQVRLVYRALGVADRALAVHVGFSSGLLRRVPVQRSVDAGKRVAS